MWQVQHGLVPVDDRDAELRRLDDEFAKLSDRFTTTYRAWSKQNESS